MTYDPYEADAREREKAAEMTAKLNLPDGWHDDVKSCMKTLVRYEPEKAERLMERLTELFDSYSERGKLLKEMAKAQSDTHERR